MIKAVFVDLLHLFNDPHGICAMSAVLKRNQVATYFVGTRHCATALRALKRIQPDLLLYSSFSATIPAYIAFDRIVKQSLSVRSLIGGPGATYDWEKLCGSTIDAICVGEGEQAVPAYIQNGFQPVPNIFRPGEEFPKEFFPLVDLNAMPFPDRDVVYRADALLRDSPSKQFLSGRGCPYHCTYCFNHKFCQIFRGYGPLVRKKGVDYFIAEIKEVRDRYPLKDIVFNDDTFILDKRWFLEFAERFPREIGVSYTCNVRANLVDDDIARALKASGCRGVNWSIESGNDYLRNHVLKRQMTDEQIYNAAEVLSRHKVLFRLGNLLGLPGENFEQMLETVTMNIRVRPSFALANIFVPYPGLELTGYAITNGYCREDVTRHLPKDYFTKSVMDVPELEKARLYKLFCLFPLFVSHPKLFFDLRLRGLLFRLPRVLLRFVYEIAYTLRVARFYTPRAPFWHQCRMAKRYLMNL